MAELLRHPFVPPPPQEISSFTNIQTLVNVLKRRIKPIRAHVEEHSPAHIDEISQLLSGCQINPREWEPYTCFVHDRYTRTLVSPKLFVREVVDARPLPEPCAPLI
jgi:hypothetical protein